MGRAMMGTNFNYVFWRGNSEKATWNSGNKVYPPKELTDRCRDLSEIQGADVYMNETMRVIKGDPLRFVKMSLVKSFLAWRIYPDTATKVAHARRNDVIAGALFGPVLLLAICWSWLSRKRFRVNSIIVCYLIPVMIASALTVARDRYRYPLDTVLIVFAASMVAHLWDKTVHTHSSTSA